MDCFYEGENFLAINPDECIDCGVCEPNVPGAIVADNSMEKDEHDKWLKINTDMSNMAQHYTNKRSHDADSFNPKEGYIGIKVI